MYKRQFVSVAVFVLLGILLEAEGDSIGFALLFELLVESLVGNSREDQFAVLGNYVALVGYGSLGFGSAGLNLFDLFGNERNLYLSLVDQMCIRDSSCTVSLRSFLNSLILVEI